MEASQRCTEGAIHAEDDTEEPILGAFEPSDGEYSEDTVTERPAQVALPDSAACAYIDALKTASGLRLTDEEGIRRAYENHGELGLFSVFITQEFKASLRLWTNDALTKRGLAKATVVEFDAYLGLEMAMSICALNDISDFWSERRFLGQRDFMEIMGRTRFQTIRSCINIHPPTPAIEPRVQALPQRPVQAAQDGVELRPVASASIATASALGAAQQGPEEHIPSTSALPGTAIAPSENASAGSTSTSTSPDQYDTSRDPLWHSRVLLGHIHRKFATVAVPYGVSSLDENSVRTKARSAARSYIPSKPDKYAIRFYAAVGWESLYIHSFRDNGSGNFTRTTPPSRYTATFPELKSPLNRTLARSDVSIPRGSPSALWVAMMGHQTRRFPSPTGRRLMVSDNFYTRHVLAVALLKFTDGETRLLGTVRMNLVDKWNREALTASVGRVSAMERGSWELIAAVDVEPGLSDAIEKHKKQQKRIAKAHRSEYIPTVTISPFSGYVVFKDKGVVVFYSNDLKETPPVRVLSGEDPRAIACVHGLYPIRRWTGSEVMHRTTFMVPTLVAAYNLAMNGVDRVDQLRSTNPTRRKEMRLSMSLLTWALDLCALNAHALLRKVQPPDEDQSRFVSSREDIARL